MTPVLGRVVEHDARSLSFPAPTASTVRSVRHRRYGQILDQGNVGACTGNALAGALNTAPLHRPGRILREADALALYSLATQLDGVPGSYPPDDTGSSGLAVCKAGVQKGYLKSYSHAFGLDHTLAALTLSPVIIGTNWYEGMFTPDADGFVTPSGSVAGGHEYELVGIDTTHEFVWAANSWGKGWGLKGFFKLTYSVLQQLLNEQGDVTVPVAA